MSALTPAETIVPWPTGPPQPNTSRLRHVRDRIDRKYAQPPDVEAFDHGVVVIPA